MTQTQAVDPGDSLVFLAMSEGGATVSIGEEVPTTGYFVGGMTNPLVIGGQWADTPGTTSAIVSYWISLKKDNVDSKLVGSWINNGGDLVIDFVDHYNDRDFAIAMADVRGEDAIYDAANKEVIFVV